MSGKTTAASLLPAPRLYARLSFHLLAFCVMAWLTVCRGGAQIELPAPRRALLPNGVRLILKPEAGLDRVAVSLFVRAQADASPASEAAGELVARALFYGSRDRTENGVLALANQTGGSYDVLYTRQYVAITVVVAPAQLPEAAHLLSDCLKNADFAPHSLDRARADVRLERAQRQEDGLLRGYDAVCGTLRPPEPDEAALKRVTQAQAQAYFRRSYGPARTVIALAGSFDPARATSLFAAFLMDYTRPTARIAPDDAEQNPPDTLPIAAANKNASSVIYRVLPAPSASAYALVATAAPAVTHPDYAAFTVLQTVLGGGHACRLFQQAREAQGLGYKVGALYQADHFDPLVAYLQWDPTRSRAAFGQRTELDPKEVGRFLNAQINGLLQNPPSEAEVERARKLAIGMDARQHERIPTRSFLLGWYETLGLGYAFDADLPRRFAAVTRDDVRRVAKTYLGARAGVLVLPAQSASK